MVLLSTYFFIAVLSYLGFLVGSIIAHLAKEELGKGKPYFFLLQELVLGIVLLLSLLALAVPVSVALLAGIGLAALLHSINHLRKPVYHASALGLFFFLSSFSLTYFLPVAVLVFFFGIIAASLRFQKKKSLSNHMLMVVVHHAWFFLFSLGLYGLFQFWL